MKEVTIDSVRERIAHLELQAQIGGRLPIRHEFEMACLRKLSGLMMANSIKLELCEFIKGAPGIPDEMTKRRACREYSGRIDVIEAYRNGYNACRAAMLAAAPAAVPVGVPDLHKVIYHFRGWNEGFPVERFKADYVIAWMLANYPPAPIVTDALELFAEFMEAESIKAGDYPEGWRCKAANAAYDYIRACIAETLNGVQPVAETDTTSAQVESLATSAGSGKNGQ